MRNDKYKVQIRGKGNKVAFLTKLIEKGIKVKGLSVEQSSITFQTDRKGLQFIRRWRRSFQLKVTIERLYESHHPMRILSSWRFVISCLIPYTCSLFLWNLQIDSNHPELIEKVEAVLNEQQIQPYRLLTTLPDEGELRREMMLAIPDLAWVRFARTGGSLVITPMESPQTNQLKQEMKAPSDLVAKTSGVITRFELKRGERVARVHQTVKKGDLLATGILEQGSKKVVVGAEGEVFAQYWMEYKFTLPKVVQYKRYGEEELHFSLRIPWLIKANETNYTTYPVETKWPFVEAYRTIEERIGTLELREGMEETIILPLIRNRLLEEPYSKKVIKEEKILHVTYDNDKVSGTILFLINDNIAVKRPIVQGD